MTAIVQTQKAKLDTLRALFDKAKPSIAAVLPKHLTAEKLLKITLSAASRTPELLNCTPESILLAAMQSAALGLEPNTPMGQAYLVPYGRQAQFIPGYRGLISLAVQSGEVRSIHARVIRERDEYAIDYGTEQRLTHRPYLGTDGPGEMIGAYAVAEMRNGGKVFEFMSRVEIDAIRGRSKAGTSGPWVTDYEEMARKTVIRRLAKTLPMAVEKLDVALRHQARAEAGEAPDFSDVIDVLPQEQHDPETGEVVNGQAAPPTRAEVIKAKLEKAGAQ